MFAVKIDTTQDIATQDQCSIFVRYVDKTGSIQERLVSIVKCEETTGEPFVHIVSEVMQGLNLDPLQCTWNATDSAANIQAHYRGFSTLLSDKAPMQIHVWCHAPVLNPVVSEATSAVANSASLFTLVNEIAVFFLESYQRMNIWSRHSTTMKRLGTTGETRWWSKDDALRKVFDSFNNPLEALFVEVITSLNAILIADNTQAVVVEAKVRGYIDALLKFETVLTAQVVSANIFTHYSPF
ncbi:uncharacterized protein LOC101845557 [Aplysia californica]|uniref:Uncharacterized protein LOC101845557 n=1 Tax=Aplysia californica TaxID=6500 RepID=A0ABM0JTY3_APLCA|nr:uncharacterized protein LOC101845557 [Aplysia californica]